MTHNFKDFAKKFQNFAFWQLLCIKNLKNLYTNYASFFSRLLHIKFVKSWTWHDHFLLFKNQKFSILPGVAQKIEKSQKYWRNIYQIWKYLYKYLYSQKGQNIDKYWPKNFAKVVHKGWNVYPRSLKCATWPKKYIEINMNPMSANESVRHLWIWIFYYFGDSSIYILCTEFWELRTESFK